ncbi:CHRD domain-containing protein [Micromonospora sp. NPDC023814]|uniref:CHRD domain-containing protein n=1 Tax=Micromonospora sp. NPDC023814 TaxID=3154596 RepID=UPI0033ED9C83
MVGRTRLWAVAVAAGAAVAAVAVGNAAMGDGRDDSRDRHESRESQNSWDWDDSRHGEDTVRARLSGYQEDPLTISTPGSGRFEAHIDERNKEIKWRLSYDDLKDVEQAHIHFGGRHQSGGIAAFLCSNLKDAKGGAPQGVQACPASPAKIEGTIRPADVVGPADQGIEPGEFDELVDAIEAGVTYANVHTKKYPNGEIRGQIKSDERDHDKRDDWGRDEERGEWGQDKGDDWGQDKGDERDHDKRDDWGRDEERGEWGQDKGDEWGQDKRDDSGRDEERGERGQDKGDDSADQKRGDWDRTEGDDWDRQMSDD